MRKLTDQKNKSTKETELNQYNLNKAELLQLRKKQLQNAKEAKDNDFKWLTKHSRDFLAAGYLPPKISPEQRIKEIGDSRGDLRYIGV